jgi:hypothetical protein
MTEELQKFCDRNYVDYVGDAPDNDAAVTQTKEGWAEALYIGARFVSPPSTTALAARAAFVTAALGMHLDPTGAVFQAAAAAFADELGQGMVDGLSVVSYTAPPGLLIPTGLPTDDAAASSAAMAASTIDWFETGTATPLIGAPFAWS